MFETDVCKPFMNFCDVRSAEHPSFVALERTGGAVAQRFKAIRKEALCFEGFYALVKATALARDLMKEYLL